jgi:hypothetical protein
MLRAVIKTIDVRCVSVTAHTAKLSITVSFALFGFFIFLLRAKSGLNTFAFGDETEKFVAALCANISETSSPCQIEVGRVGDLGYG